MKNVPTTSGIHTDRSPQNSERSEPDPILSGASLAQAHSTPAVQIQNLTIRFPGEPAPLFGPLHLELRRGETIALLGPSGCGKSVLLKLIAGLLSPTSGTIRVSAHELGMLFQKNALFDSLTCLENLVFPALERLDISEAEAKSRALQLLARVELSHAANLAPDELSGGMQKRLGIARALMVEPDLLLYDEPTAGLDPVTSRTIADLIVELRARKGASLLVVTNDVQRAYTLADRIFILANGQLYGGLTPEQMKTSSDPLIHQFLFGLSQGPLTQVSPLNTRGTD